MKRVYIFLSTAILAFTANHSLAQTKKSTVATEPTKSYFGIYGGISTPLGDFASTSYDNNKAGFAKKGVVIGLDGAWYFYKNWALGATLSFQDQGQLTTDDARTLSAGYTASFKADESTVSAVGRYHSLNFLVGPQYSFIIHKFTIDLRAAAGLIKVNSTPELTVSLEGAEDQKDTFYQRSANATVAGYSGTLGLKYSLGDSWQVSLRSSYIGSDGPDIKNEGRTSTEGRYVTKQPITEIQTTLGISLLF
jgi:hypothetical protein